MIDKRPRLLIQRNVFLALMLFLAACQNLEQVFETPDLKLLGVQLGDREGAVQYLDLSVEIENSNPFALSLIDTRYSFQLADFDVISGATNQPLRVPANGSNVVDFRLGFDGLAILNLVREIALSGQSTLDYRLGVELDTGLPLVGLVPIVRQGQLDSTALLGR